jgi:hypothetical protein
MSTQTRRTRRQKKYQPYVPENMEMKEFTFRAVLIGVVMTAVLGSANAYLGLKAGMTIAATLSRGRHWDGPFTTDEGLVT